MGAGQCEGSAVESDGSVGQCMRGSAVESEGSAVESDGSVGQSYSVHGGSPE